MGKYKLSFSPSIVLLLLFLFPGDTSATTEPQYMVLVPFLIQTEVSNEVCIQLSYLNETVTLSATLEHTGGNKSLIEDVVAEKELFKCISFKLPRLNRTAVAFLSVLVKGPTLKYQSRKSVLVKDPESLVFVQTDKPIYKPGQKVLFRIVCLDNDFRPLNKKFPLAYIQDPQRNRVYQWQGVELTGGLIQLSFPLTSEPIQGQYKVVVQKDSLENVEHSFSVEEYVLPRFDVLVKLPKVITINDEELQVSVCGLYTYGKPVFGAVNVRVCRKFSSPRSHCYGERENAVCEEFTQPADARGCVSNVIKTKIFQLHRTGYHMNIEVQGKITEEGTGVELTGTGSCAITNVMSKISFEYVDSHYRPGIFFYGKVKMVDGSNAPLANETIKLYVPGDKIDRNYTTDEQGTVWFSIDTTNFTAASINIQARHKSTEYCYDSNWVVPEYGTASHSATRFYSPSKSFLKIEPQPETLPCDSDLEVRVHYILTPEAVGEEEEITFYYLVMSKGEIVRTGTITEPVISENNLKKLTLMLHVGPEIAPLVRILVYTTVPSGEVIANSADFQVENCLPNKVSLVFKPPRGTPASSTDLTLGAFPKSLCAVRAVDKSVLLMKPEAELSASSVYSLLPLKQLKGYGYKGHYLEEEDTNPCVSLDPILLNGFIYQPMSPDGEGDAYSILKDLGLKVFTSTKVHKPEICRHYVSAGIAYEPMRAGARYSEGKSTPSPPLLSSSPPLGLPPHISPTPWDLPSVPATPRALPDPGALPCSLKLSLCPAFLAAHSCFPCLPTHI
ncbi:alpha-2-macroglobulin [Alligator mississippiensis]|uniref:alpha-2-macroglobulin n=1 Tax=Alligator mississippiensis TaxID=8496 RepID=UPI0028773A84|nr:alpha-2-macroglobulin [Alligator mississippiensis]